MAKKTAYPKNGARHEIGKTILQPRQTPKAKAQGEDPPLELPRLEETGEPPAQTRKAFPVVGLGASAGGLEALETFFANMPASENMAFVIIQHLSPKHKSVMGEILKKDNCLSGSERGEAGINRLFLPLGKIRKTHHLTSKLRLGLQP